jgi:hypothetical protein
MKLLFVIPIALFFATKTRSCNQNTAPANCYKGRLEIKGICGNYTIKVLEGNATDWTVANWTDEETGKAYTQVFRLETPCTFPENIKEGDTFYFTVDTNTQEDCNRCMAFYPTPEKSKAIKVQKGPCS